MTETLETAGDYRLRLEVQPEQRDSNPRMNRDCNLANVITLAGQRYADVDENGGPLQDGWNRFADLKNGIELFIRWARLVHGAVAVEENPYDGARSLWYVMPDRLAEAGTNASPEQIIAEEVKEYRAWAEGDVYGYIIEKSVGWQRSDGKVGILITWDEIESCWGHIGHQYAQEEARRAFAPYRTEAEGTGP